ncbi:MAG: prenyltransferase/squalene oxidase repeat-containing protein [Phycisphaeraceae bacterium]
MRPTERLLRRLLASMIALCICLPVAAVDDAHWKKADAAIDKGITYLIGQQAEDGSWMSEIGPAVTGLVLNGLINQPEIGPNHPAAAKAIRYILDRAQEDGSIRNGPDGILASYNTAICLSALGPVMNDPEVAEVVRKGQDFLRGTQWIIGMTDPTGKVIDKDHPFAGGFGYGKHGRPDISNTQMALQAMHDTGVDCNDPTFQRALVFLNRLQATEGNDLFADKFEELDGGFIYSTSVNKDAIGKPESKANQDQIDEAKAGRAVSGLRTYGSVTYAGFKSLIYANLDRDDPRMLAAKSWISKNYTLDQNPGMPEAQKLQGLFYYYITKARALNAFGSTSIEVQGAATAKITAAPEVAFSDVQAKMDELKAKGIVDIEVAQGEAGSGIVVAETPGTVMRDWGNDLIATLVDQQHEEGWWANTETRWLESQPILVTAYSVLALQNAID